MATAIRDRWLWLGFGVFFVLAVKSVRYAITDTVCAIELDPTQYSSQPDQRKPPEDSISIRTLRTLMFSPNHNIAEAAASLIVSRFAAHPGAAAMLKRDLHSADPRTMAKALYAVKYLEDHDEDLGITDYHTSQARWALQYPELAAESSRRAVEARADAQAQGVDPHLQEAVEQRIQRLEENNIADVEDEAARDRYLTLTIPRNSDLWERFIDGVLAHPNRPTAGTGIVSGLDELAHEAGRVPWSSSRETFRPGTAPYAGWDTIPSQRPVPGEDERESRRRRREAMVVRYH